MDATADAGPITYFQFGATAGAPTAFTSSGVSTDLIVASDQILSGGCHFYWVATALATPDQNPIFLQAGYSWCGGSATPFVYSLGSIVPGSTGWLYSGGTTTLQTGTWYTFAMSTDGILQPDGTYTWTFTVQPRGGTVTTLVTASFESPSCNYPYDVTEIAGSSSACGDVSTATYDQLMVLSGGAWQETPHATAYYGYGPCSDGNVAPMGLHDFQTQLGTGVTLATAAGASLW